MTNITNFPAKSVRDWTIVERSIREGLSTTSIPLATQERLIEKLRKFHKILYPDFDFAISIEFPSSVSRDQSSAILAQIGEKVGSGNSEKMKAFTDHLWANRVETELDHCRELGIL